MRLNFDTLRQRIMGKATLSIHANSKLGQYARIRNIRGDSKRIVVDGNSFIDGELLTFKHGGEISIGEWVYVGESSRIWSASKITIGNRTLISFGCFVTDSLTHPISPSRRHQQFREIFLKGHPSEIDLGERPVVIGNDVWIGCNSIVLRGVHIGDNSIVGAGSVVTKNIPANSLAVGNPARCIRELTPE